MSTRDFINHLNQLDLRSGTLLEVLRVELDVEQFGSLVPETPLRLVQTSEGDFSVVQEAYDPVDFSRQSGRFDLHTDGLYYQQVPDFVILYCDNPGNGTTSTIVADTTEVSKRVKRPITFEVLKLLDLVYVGKDAQQFSRPLVQSHPRTGEAAINLGTRGYVRQRISLEDLASAPSLRMAVRALNEMFTILSGAIVLDHQWARGDLLLFDNITYVHGRKALGQDPDRRLFRIWLSLRGDE